jgi:hypothetical protein
MKQQDVILIAIVIFFSTVFALFLSKAIVASPQKRQQQVEVVQSISADLALPKPDSPYFNKQAIDPAKTITGGINANPDPFSGTAQ